MAAFIEAVDLRKTYRVGQIEVPALRGVSFTVRRGEFVSIVGPSGSGKSTLFYLLGGLTRADQGRVEIDGADFSRLSDAERTRMRKRKIGFVFQKFNLLPTLSAQSNIDIAQDIAGNPKRDPAYFDRIVGLLGLTNRLPHRPSELSGGEQQRVALARALINKPAIVLADEPTGNLDSKNSDIVLNMNYCVFFRWVSMVKIAKNQLVLTGPTKAARALESSLAASLAPFEPALGACCALPPYFSQPFSMHSFHSSSYGLWRSRNRRAESREPSIPPADINGPDRGERLARHRG